LHRSSAYLSTSNHSTLRCSFTCEEFIRSTPRKSVGFQAERRVVVAAGGAANISARIDSGDVSLLTKLVAILRTCDRAHRQPEARMKKAGITCTIGKTQEDPAILATRLLNGRSSLAETK
jgi:hypothetical protein